MIFKKSIGITVMLLGLFLVACGSDSNNTPTTGPDNNTLVGRFVDSPVSGLDYITSSGLMGVTNAAGEFEYLEGDTLTFSLGPIMLGDITAVSEITPFDLVGFELPSVDFDFGDLAGEILTIQNGNISAFGNGVNMLIFLQSLDRNNNPGDGIEIISAISQFFLQIAATILFNQNAEDFLTAFFVLFTQLLTNNIIDRDDGATPVDRDDAIRHFIASDAIN